MNSSNGGKGGTECGNRCTCNCSTSSIACNCKTRSVWGVRARTTGGGRRR